MVVSVSCWAILNSLPFPTLLIHSMLDRPLQPLWVIWSFELLSRAWTDHHWLLRTWVSYPWFMLCWVYPPASFYWCYYYLRCFRLIPKNIQTIFIALNWLLCWTPWAWSWQSYPPYPVCFLQSCLFELGLCWSLQIIRNNLTFSKSTDSILL